MCCRCSRTELGPGVAEALARTAELARSDSDALDLLAGELAAAAGLDRDLAETSPGGVVRLSVPVLAAAPVALRSRALRLAALAAGCPGGDLFAVHVHALDALVVDWHGQRRVDLPGGWSRATRVGDLVVLSPRQPSRRAQPNRRAARGAPSAVG